MTENEWCELGLLTIGRTNAILVSYTTANMLVLGPLLNLETCEWRGTEKVMRIMMTELGERSRMVIMIVTLLSRKCTASLPQFTQSVSIQSSHRQIVTTPWLHIWTLSRQF